MRNLGRFSRTAVCTSTGMLTSPNDNAPVQIARAISDERASESPCDARRFRPNVRTEVRLKADAYVQLAHTCGTLIAPSRSNPGKQGDPTMNADTLRGQWTQLKGKIHEQW